MINRLTGTLTGLNGRHLYLQNGDIEWDILISSTTASKVSDSEKKISLFIHLHHREDQFALYGFGSELERTIFLDLIRIPGIGPRQALRILSGMNEELFLHNVDAGDVDALARVPGLGKKTAQKIILALRGKITQQEGEPGEFDDIIQALVDMGFDRKKSRDTVHRLSRTDMLREEDKDRLEQDLFKKAIVELSQ